MTSSYNTKSNKRRSFARFWPALVLVGLFTVLVGGYVMSSENKTDTGKTEVVVYKTPSCSCCGKWVEHLQDNGFEVEVNLVSETNSVRSRVGVPQEMASCHTAVVGDYWVEGHVPADLIHKLMAEQPEDIKGIAVPGMPQGSPGMESPNPSKYKVLSVGDQGQVEVYAVRAGQSDAHSHVFSTPVDDKSNDKSEHPVILIAMQLSDAIANGDIKSLRSLVSPDVLIFESGGMESSLAEYEGHHMPADMAFMKAMQREVTSQKVLDLGESVTVATRSRVHGMYKDKSVDLKSTETLVMKKVAGQWKIIHIHWSSS